MSKLLSIEEIADRLGLRPSTVRRWVKQDKIPALRPSHTVLRFEWNEVAAAIRKLDAQRRRQPAEG